MYCGIDALKLTFCSIFSDQRRHYDLSLEKLSQIIDAMEELLVLKNQYNLHVNFEEYHEVSDLIFVILLAQSFLNGMKFIFSSKLTFHSSQMT